MPPERYTGEMPRHNCLPEACIKCVSPSHNEDEMWRMPLPDDSAQVLFSEDAYTYLDVRPRLEYEEAGRVKGSVNIPIMNARRVWDPESKKKVIQREPNENFSEQVTLP